MKADHFLTPNVVEWWVECTMMEGDFGGLLEGVMQQAEGIRITHVLKEAGAMYPAIWEM